jgi:hypothetical protein
MPVLYRRYLRAQDEIGRQDLKRKLLGHNQDDLSATWHADGALSGAVDRLRRPCSEWSEVSLEHSLCTPMKEDQTYRGQPADNPQGVKE